MTRGNGPAGERHGPRTPGVIGMLVLAAAITIAGCSAASSPAGTSSESPGSSGSAGASARPITLTIYAAASLAAALDAARTSYDADHPGTNLTISTDSSAALETKIEQGAPADVFLSADTSNPARLVAAGLADGPSVPFAGNILTVIVPSANPAQIATPADLARPGIKVIAAGTNVPITKYATILVANLARQPGYPADFAALYTANIVSREDNVAAVVAKVALGEGDAGIVYVTDARGSGEVATIAVPTAANVPATYAGVVVRASPNLAAAHAFLAWLAGPAGQVILGRFGFLPPPS